MTTLKDKLIQMALFEERLEGKILECDAASQAALQSCIPAIRSLRSELTQVNGPPPGGSLRWTLNPPLTPALTVLVECVDLLTVLDGQGFKHEIDLQLKQCEARVLVSIYGNNHLITSCLLPPRLGSSSPNPMPSKDPSCSSGSPSCRT